MRDVTTEFSFYLKPAKYGVGVFIIHGIKEDTYLRLYGKETEETEATVKRDKTEVPEFFRGYCLDRGDALICPADFGHMELGWYMNHSKEPNAYHKDLNFYAKRDIEKGEEITIDYNALGESSDARDGYYSS